MEKITKSKAKMIKKIQQKKTKKEKLLIAMQVDYEANVLNMTELSKKYKKDYKTIKKYAEKGNWKKGNLNEYIGAQELVIATEMQASHDPKMQKLLEEAKKTAVENYIAKNQCSIDMLELKKQTLQTMQLGMDALTPKLKLSATKDKISKQTTFTQNEKGDKVIVETSDVSVFEIGNAIKEANNICKTLGFANTESPTIVINNNNAQIQVSEAMQKDLQTLNDKLIDVNIDNLTDEN